MAEPMRSKLARGTVHSWRTEPWRLKDSNRWMLLVRTAVPQ